MIEKIPLEFQKNSWRLEGIAMTKAEEAAIHKINEIIDFLNKGKKKKESSMLDVS